ncbi:MAG: RagB/SusD family nutrient uptake outer membrane protein [Bacteroidales bacterium]|nr:RagB/SusD family nutrient uptake outer membrane protein [Bacteroidales bacterium]
MTIHTKHLFATGLLAMGLAFTSCDDFLSDVPKGQKIPESYADFEAFLRAEYGNHRLDPGQAVILDNDRYVTNSYMNYYPLWAANFIWDETADRIALNKSDETTYYATYQGISSFNLIIEHGPSLTQCTEAQRDELVAQARVLRAMNYFHLVNYYADTYEAATASLKGGVPVITSANVGAAYTQPSVQEVYDFMLKDLTESYNALPVQAATMLHPNKAVADAMLARVYLMMGNYNDALKHANQALAFNDALYDWTALYAQMEELVLDPANYTAITAPNGFDYCENYNFRHGSSSNSSTITHIPLHRAADFEEGDARYLLQWKYYNAGAEQYMRGMTRGFHNQGGMLTVEAWLIKAECLARTGKVTEAMDCLNRVRETRILEEYYQPLTAATEAEALPLIIRTKRNELILTMVPFCDARRLNAEGKYPVTFSKEYNGQRISLSAKSHLWTFPFPQGALENKGNGNIVQNVEK